MIKGVANRPKWLLIIASAVIAGFLLSTAARFVLYKPNTVHYHANFAIYINGEREQFAGPGYYEEVQACIADTGSNPKARVHMHDNVNDVIHVHSGGATWGHLFANLGYGLSDIALSDGTNVYSNTGSTKLSFILNGKLVTNVANKGIENEDKLLISYGDETTAQLNERHNSISHNAGEYNARHDPASCAGSEELSFTKRLKIALGINT